jgi:hypothetical protein
MKNIDQLVHQRAMTLLFAAFAFGLWQFAWIGQDALKGSDGILFQVAGWSTVVGALLWVIASYLLMKYSKHVKQAKACNVLNDELTQRNRSKAFIMGYVTVFGLIWLLIPATDFWDFEVKFAVRAIATIGIIVPLVYFVMLELKDQSESE